MLDKEKSPSWFISYMFFPLVVNPIVVKEISVQITACSSGRASSVFLVEVNISTIFTLPRLSLSYCMIGSDSQLSIAYRGGLLWAHSGTIEHIPGYSETQKLYPAYIQPLTDLFVVS